MRDKIKLESTAGTGHFYTTTKNKKHDARQDGDQEVRSQSPQARDLQGNQAPLKQYWQVPARGCMTRRRTATVSRLLPVRGPEAARAGFSRGTITLPLPPGGEREPLWRASPGPSASPPIPGRRR
jgi:large subunit ribosomal protein L33